MKSFEKLAELADRFERKISRGQVSASPSDIEDALKAGNIWPSPDAISPLLNTAQIPDDVSIHIFVVADKALNVSFRIDWTNRPPPPANDPFRKIVPDPPSFNTLKGLLSRTYSGKMKQALQAAKVNVADTMAASLATF